MKTYRIPEVEIIFPCSSDILTASGTLADQLVGEHEIVDRIKWGLKN